jgi:hypothetical protein
LPELEGGTTPFDLNLLNGGHNTQPGKTETDVFELDVFAE